MSRSSIPVWIRIPVEVASLFAIGLFVASVTGHFWIGVALAALFAALEIRYVLDDRAEAKVDAADEE